MIQSVKKLFLNGRRPNAAFLRTTIILIFSAVAILFTISTFYTQHLARSIQQSSISIAADDSPSIQHLANLRTELRRIDSLSRLYATSGVPSRSVLRRELEIALDRLSEELSDYFKLNIYPEEQPGSDTIRKSIPSLVAAVKQLIDFPKQGRNEDALRLVDQVVSPLVESLASTASEVINVDAQHIQRLADDIERTRIHSSWVADLLDLLSILLTAALAAIILRVLRRYATLTEDHTRLVETRANELEHFAGAVAHDLKNPLSSVALALEGGLHKISPSDPAEPFFRQALRNLRNMQALIDGLLEFASAGARPQANERCGLREVVESVVREAAPRANESGIALNLEPFKDIEVRCKGVMVGTVLANLINNAIKYMGSRPERRIWVRVWPGNSFARVEVEDTGPGVPLELQDRVFDQYVRAPGLSQPGLGIGLATVKRIVVAHHGRVGLLSHPDRGSLFWFELPVFLHEPNQGKEEQPTA